MKMPLKTLGLYFLLGFCSGSVSHAALRKSVVTDFSSSAGLISFDEMALGVENPVYHINDYRGADYMPTVSFGGYFKGQALGLGTDCGGGGVFGGCVTGTPTGTLSLEADAPKAIVLFDGANPSSPVLSGGSMFSGPISVLFDKNVSAVGLEGGYFDLLHGTAVTFFARDGSVLDQLTNSTLGMEFFGVRTSDGSNQIAGLQFSLVGAENAGFEMDNLQFTVAPNNQDVSPAPEPETYALIMLGLGVVGLRRRIKSNKQAATPIDILYGLDCNFPVFNRPI